MSSLALRPGDLLTVPWTVLSIDFISFVSFTNAIQATRPLTSTPAGLTPAEHACLTWTYCHRINVSGVTIVRVRSPHGRRDLSAAAESG